MSQSVSVGVKKLEHYDNDWSLPVYQTSSAAGADIRACIGRNETLKLMPGERKLIPTGLCFEIPHGFEVQIRPRSGLSFKTGVMVINSPGTIDADYRGEIKIILGNLSQEPYEIQHGDRIAQMVFAPVLQASFFSLDNLSSTERGTGGFGSTGLK